MKTKTGEDQSAGRWNDAKTQPAKPANPPVKPASPPAKAGRAPNGRNAPPVKAANAPKPLREAPTAIAAGTTPEMPAAANPVPFFNCPYFIPPLFSFNRPFRRADRFDPSSRTATPGARPPFIPAYLTGGRPGPPRLTAQKHLSAGRARFSENGHGSLFSVDAASPVSLFAGLPLSAKRDTINPACGFAVVWKKEGRRLYAGIQPHAGPNR